MNVGHCPRIETEDAERIWLAVEESKHMQTNFKPTVWQDTSLSRSGAYGVRTGTGEIPFNTADGDDAEEDILMSADEKHESQDASNGSEGGNDDEAETEEAGSWA